MLGHNHPWVDSESQLRLLLAPSPRGLDVDPVPVSNPQVPGFVRIDPPDRVGMDLPQARDLPILGMKIDRAP